MINKTVFSLPDTNSHTTTKNYDFQWKNSHQIQVCNFLPLLYNFFLHFFHIRKKIIFLCLVRNLQLKKNCQICGKFSETHLCIQRNIVNNTSSIVKVDVQLFDGQLFLQKLSQISVQQKFANSLLYKARPVQIEPRHFH